MNYQNANLVLPRLWLGNRPASQDVQWLRNNNITVIFNCTKDIPFAPVKAHMYRVPVDDNLQADEIRNMGLWSPEIIVNLTKEYNTGANILVHCHAGMQRSAAVVAMFLIARHRCTTKEAIAYTKSRRPIAFQGAANFENSIREFEAIYQDYALKSNVPMLLQKIPFPTDFISGT
jgi:protein-tyrosine phosphatase